MPELRHGAGGRRTAEQERLQSKTEKENRERETERGWKGERGQSVRPCVLMLKRRSNASRPGGSFV